MPIFAEEIQNIRTMIRIYGMHTCPDCACIEEQVRDNDGYRIIDIGEHVRNLKAFLRLRDSSPVFDEALRNGSIGIPCFVLEDGRVTLSPEEAGLHRQMRSEAPGWKMPEAQPQKGHRAAWTGAAAETMAQPPTSTDCCKSIQSRIAVPSLR